MRLEGRRRRERWRVRRVGSDSVCGGFRTTKLLNNQFLKRLCNIPVAGACHLKRTLDDQGSDTTLHEEFIHGSCSISTTEGLSLLENTKTDSQVQLSMRVFYRWAQVER